MNRSRVTITWEEINSSRVDEQLARQKQAIEAAASTANSEPTAPSVQPVRFSLWYNSIVYMSIFGLLGGLLGWSFGEILHFRPNARAEARELIDGQRRIETAKKTMQLSQAEAEAAIAQIRHIGRGNAYYLAFDSAKDETDRRQRLADAERREAWKDFLANLLFYGISGMMIAAALGMAESIVSRNYHLALANGLIGAALGMFGGLLVAFLVEPLYHFILGSLDAQISMARQMVARFVSWGLLGIFLAVAPSLLHYSRKRLLVGSCGGLLGGIVGGLLFDPIASLCDSQHVGRLFGIIAIGLISGLATGLIESAAKTGWVKVTAGWIAGKQFVLYRNPTFIGSSLQCSIYLFKDPQVGRRHAAIHHVPGGFDIEDLPLGGKTLVNGRPVSRQRLHQGDRIQIGQTTLLFQQKASQS